MSTSTDNERVLRQGPGAPALALAAAAPLEHEELSAWIEGAREGDRAAWDHLYQRNYDVVLRRVRFLVGELATAEELTQEAFVQAMIRIDRFDGRSSFRTWLRAIALNIVRNHWRSQRATQKAHAKLELVRALQGPSTGSNDPAGPEAELLRRQRSEALYRALEEIPAPLREVFVLRDIEGLARERVATELGITMGNVSVRCTRARQRVREQLISTGALPRAEEGGPNV